MPGLNGTGPQGRGPMTGGGFGRCRPVYSENNQPIRGVVEKRVQEPGGNVTIFQPPVEEQGQVYGIGRGGIPHGAGRGFACGNRRGRCIR